jgi:O-methyltransferase involved in polyketide biosynthesis
VNISDVSRTAILALLCRVVESEKRNPVFNDPMAVLCLERLLSISSEEEKNRIMKWKSKYAGINIRDAKARALTAKSFDSITNQFIVNNPGCIVINLACGFDTRFWRIENEKCKYIELDLPEMIKLKKEILKDYLDYELIGCSVFDTSWIDKVTSNGNSGFLFLAEGLFYYLPKKDVIGIFQAMARRFIRSQLVLDMAPEIFTKGLMKWIISIESKVWDIDVSFVFGIDNPHDIDSYANGFKVIDVIKGNVGKIITVSINAAQPAVAADLAFG